jgi:hypothetical protein
MALAAQDKEGLGTPSKSPMGQAVRWLLTTFSLPHRVTYDYITK